MPLPLHTISIMVNDGPIAVTVRSRIVYPFAIHRRLKEKNNQWVVDNSRTTRSYVLTHLLTGRAIKSLYPFWHKCTMTECRYKLESLAASLSVFPEFLLLDAQQITNGPNKKEIITLIGEIKHGIS